MEINTYTFLTILGCGIVTWLYRVVPFILVKNFTIPKPVIRFLSFVPVAIMAALFIENLLVFKPGQWATIQWPQMLASIPTFAAAIISKSLMIICVVGIVSMALVRFFHLGM
ncbi:AzlD domain-containing protein [Paucilactobacillus nenjiangensis]|uniref:AzlD domain-containing protein n=1 Tax=Paucilactobacillus nenjiangensis TaxID=1296540 RepID=UPI0028D4DC02|nr:AzlD domain-containing protein [Paucilactobacillus nenjiangensis]